MVHQVKNLPAMPGTQETQVLLLGDFLLLLLLVERGKRQWREEGKGCRGPGNFRKREGNHPGVTLWDPRQAPTASPASKGPRG